MSEIDHTPTDPAPQLPTAKVVSGRRMGSILLVPVAVAFFVTYLLWSAWQERGNLLTLHALDGHGIAVGDGLVYRGVRIGEVEGIRLSSDLDEVQILTRLAREASGIAREDSRFWIERPRVSLDGIQGLDTLLGGRRIGVKPGARDGSARTEFSLLPDPPMAEPDEAGGIEFTLEARDRHGLVAGAPVLYRGIEIGYVLEVGLAADATQVEARAWVRPRYTELVRERTHFFEVGGLEVDAGLFEGLELNLTSLRTFLVGGVALALEAEPGPGAVAGARFTLHDEAKESWLNAGPALALGDYADLARPKLLSGVLTYRKGLFRRKKTVRGWALPTALGVIAPSNLLVAPDGARNPVLRIDGQERKLTTPLWNQDGLAALSLVVLPESPWPVPSEPIAGAPGDALLIGPSDRPPIAVPASSISGSGDAWRLDLPLIWDERWHGATLIRPTDSRVLGLCLVDENGGRVVPLYNR